MADSRCNICLSLTASTLQEDLRLLEASRRFVDMVELRADLLDPAELSHLSRVPKRVGLPVILAIRRVSDGGRWQSEEAQRRRLLARSLSGKYAFVELEEDLEDTALSEAIRKDGGRVIRSFYDCAGVPERLAERARTVGHRPGEIPKLAVTPAGTRDLPGLVAAFDRLTGREKILFGMGEFGLFTRILASKLGSYLTCCSAVGAQPRVPWELDAQTLVELYRFGKQDRETFVCGVIGNPIAHSRSPEFHNRGYQALGLNGVYVPFRVDDVPAFFQVAELLQLKGFSVTMPHKRAVLPHLAETDESLRKIGACNTVVWRSDGGWYGTNTDVQGFLSPLRDRIPQLLRPQTRATVIGAGGGARSVVYALSSLGIHPLVLNRTREKAEMLAGEFGCEAAALDSGGISRMQEYSDLIVQATGVGMEPEADGDPLPGYRFSGSEVVYDLVYQPLMTVFLKRAQAAGCRIVSGLTMLFSQGAAQFKHYTGREYPPELLDSADPIVK
jgi:3-dehydroquinate dehydratase/shikimate dehydrogenase